jgi:hypothetical protein
MLTQVASHVPPVAQHEGRAAQMLATQLLQVLSSLAPVVHRSCAQESLQQLARWLQIMFTQLSFCEQFVLNAAPVKHLLCEQLASVATCSQR